MDCPWRRTLASVFLLLSPHSVRVLSQNVMPTGPLPPLLPVRDPLNDAAGLNPGSFQQHMNVMPLPHNGIPPDFVPLIPHPPQFIGADYPMIGPAYPQALSYNPGIQGNVGLVPQGQLVNNQPCGNLAPLEAPVCNTLPNTNIPFQQGQPFNIAPTSLVPTPLVPIPLGQNLNIPINTNIPPLQGPPVNALPVPLLPHYQSIQTCNVPPVTNVPPPQEPPFKISPVSLMPIPQDQFLSGPPVSLAPIISVPCPLPPAAAQNQNIQMFPLQPPSYPQSYLPPYGAPLPYPITNDLTPVQYLPPPNLPPMIPAPNYFPISPSPSQTAAYPQTSIPLECLPVAFTVPTNVPPNFQIAALSPVLKDCDIPNSNNYGIQSTVEDYSPVPINLEINVPSPNMPEPKITIITAFASPPSISAPVPAIDSSDVSFGMMDPPPLLPPIIIESGRPRSKTWLPLLLIALFSRDEYCDGSSCGRYCCCPCNSASADIPIPYPIPIPTNNPIILRNSGRSSRNNMPKPKVEKQELTS